jgi:hypothetical protein
MYHDGFYLKHLKTEKGCFVALVIFSLSFFLLLEYFRYIDPHFKPIGSTSTQKGFLAGEASQLVSSGELSANLTSQYAPESTKDMRILHNEIRLNSTSACKVNNVENDVEDHGTKTQDDYELFSSVNENNGYDYADQDVTISQF